MQRGLHTDTVLGIGCWLPLMRFCVQLWPQVFDHVMISALAFQLVMAGLLFVKGGVIFLVFVLPLPFIYIAIWASAHDLFRRPLNLLSLRGAADIDRVLNTVGNPA